MKWIRTLFGCSSENDQFSFVAPSANQLEDPALGSLLADDGSLKFAPKDGGVVTIAWTSLVEIRAFKKDLLTTDLVCLELHIDGLDGVYIIHEEMAGYQRVVEAMERFLPGFTTDWWRSVAFPAFETNYRTVWKKAAQPEATDNPDDAQ